MHRWLWIVVPSFAVACVAEFVFFSVIDPQQLYLLGEPVSYSPIATYSICFIGFWIVGLASTLLAMFLQKSPEQVNRRRNRTPTDGKPHQRVVSR